MEVLYHLIITGVREIINYTCTEDLIIQRFVARYVYRGPSTIRCMLIFILILNLIMTKAWSKCHCKFLPFTFTLNIIVLKNPR